MAVTAYDKDGNAVQLLVCVYMPFYQNAQQTALYIETIDALQSTVDNFALLAPIKIMGDFNTPLSWSQSLNKTWHKQKGFTPHSSIWYDYIQANNFTAVDLQQRQAVTYTYLFS